MNWNDFDVLWRERGDEAVCRRLMRVFQDAAPDTSADEYEWRWRHARLLHFLAMVSEEQGALVTEVSRRFSTGAEQAKRAAAINPHGVEGQFWLGVGLLEASRRKGALAAGAALPGAAKHIEKALQINEEYHFGGPPRVWGRIQQLKPLILGGNLDNAMANYRRALQIAPQNSTTLLYYAEALWADRQPQKAREICEKLLSDPNDPDWIWEQSRDRRLAAKLLEEINRVRDE